MATRSIKTSALTRVGLFFYDLYNFTIHALAVSWVCLRIIATYLWIFFRQRVLHWPISEKTFAVKNRRAARRFVKSAVSLKGGLIKIGQFMSARADILPPEVIEELSLLQDHVTPAPFKHVLLSMHHSLGMHMQQFTHIDQTCLAAASFGQVHRATLLNGEQVVVKVQHRHIERSLRIDVIIIRLAFAVFDRWIPHIDLLHIFDELALAMAHELDYCSEAENCKRVQAIFADDERIVIPDVIEQLSTDKVLVLSYIDGIKVTDIAALEKAGIDRKQLMRLIIEAYCRQFYLEGFFQSDPHPGNLFALPGPKVAIVDFGMAKEIPKKLLGGLRRAVFAIVSRDVDELLLAMVQMGIVNMHDKEMVRPYVHRFGAHIHGGSADEWQHLQSELSGRLKELIAELRNLIKQMDSLCVPDDLILYGRALSLLHGLSVQLAPELELFSVMLPYFLNFLGGHTTPLSQKPLSAHRQPRRRRRQKMQGVESNVEKVRLAHAEQTD